MTQQKAGFDKYGLDFVVKCLIVNTKTVSSKDENQMTKNQSYHC